MHVYFFCCQLHFIYYICLSKIFCIFRMVSPFDVVERRKYLLDREFTRDGDKQMLEPVDKNKMLHSRKY